MEYLQNKTRINVRIMMQYLYRLYNLRLMQNTYIIYCVCTSRVRPAFCVSYILAIRMVAHWPLRHCAKDVAKIDKSKNLSISNPAV